MIVDDILVNGKDFPIYYGKFKTCSKPPTRIYRYTVDPYSQRLKYLALPTGRKKNHDQPDDWLVVGLPLWKMMDFVSWDDYSIPNEYGKS